MKKILLLIFVFIIIQQATTVFASGSSDGKDNDDAYVFAVDATWPPMEMIDTEKNEIVGFSVDLMRAIAKEADFEVSFTNTAWDGIFAGLFIGNYDGVLSSVTITDERKEKMLFSDPYFNAGQVLAIKKDNAGKYQSLEDLVGKEVGAQISTSGANEISKVKGVILKTYDSLLVAVEELANGTLDGVVADTPLVADLLIKNKKYKDQFIIVGKPMTSEEYGVVFPKDQKELQAKVNYGLQKVKASGEYDKIFSKWIE